MIALSPSLEEYAPVVDLLSRFDVVPSDEGDFDVDEVKLAVRSLKGWDLIVEPEPDGWLAEVREWKTKTQSVGAVTHDPDRTNAILRALRMAVSWQSQQEEFESFDRSVRSLMGYGGREFLDKYRNNELDCDDPMVEHLHLIRPLEY